MEKTIEAVKKSLVASNVRGEASTNIQRVFETYDMDGLGYVSLKNLKNA